MLQEGSRRRSLRAGFYAPAERARSYTASLRFCQTPQGREGPILLQNSICDLIDSITDRIASRIVSFVGIIVRHRTSVGIDFCTRSRGQAPKYLCNKIGHKPTLVPVKARLQGAP